MAKAQILIVEDDALVAMDTKQRLENLGYAVSATVSTGEEAIERAEKNAADLALMDVRLQGEMDGVEAANQIRARFNIPVVYLTAHADEEVLERAKLTEPFGYVIKPFEDRELNCTIQMALYKHKSDEALRESEERYRSLVETTSDWVWEMDQNGVYTYASPKVRDLLGYEPEEVVGKTPFDFMSPDETEGIARFLGDAAKFRKPIAELETTNLHKDGQHVIIETSGVPIVDEEENFLGYRGIDRDITRRKRAQEDLLLFRRLVNQSNDAVYVIDPETSRFLDVNDKACASLGYQREELLKIGVTDIEAVIPDNFLWKEHVAEVRNQEHIILEGEHKRKDGSTFPVEISTNHATEGEREYMIAVARDISERKRADEEKKKLEAQLKQAEKMEAIGTLAGGIAHDFNNLLMGVQGNVSLMRFDMDSEHPHYDMLKTIEGQVRSGATLTRQLLGYARKGQYEVKPINLNEVIEQTSPTFGRTRKDTRIHLELAEDLNAMEADQGQMEQVLLNLYVNASDAMPGGGDLFLKTANVTHEDIKGKQYDAKPGNYVLLTVTDTGTGMDEETKARIFDPFFTTKEMGRGTGLGMASTYGIVKGHAGYIEVESEKGKGTTFSIYLPATERKAGRTVEFADQIVKGTGTVLLIDDEKVVLDVGARLLEKLGYGVLQTNSGREALEVYKKNKDKIDIIVLDMVMPDIGGGEAYDKMKEINPNVKVLLSSGYSIEDAGAKEILSRGCDGFIQKPFNMERLSQSIQQILDKQ